MNDVPLLIGFSRKSMIKKIVDGKKELICGLGSYMAVKGIIAGARVIRTHDVKETVVALNKGKSEMMLEEKLFYPLIGEFGFYEG
jgi:dihydropteroate synthase